MNIGEYSVKTPIISWLLVVILLGGGIWGFQSMGRLEDPAFTVKLAKVITLYPGASEPTGAGRGDLTMWKRPFSLWSK